MSNYDQISIDSACLEAAWRYQLVAPLLKSTSTAEKSKYRARLLAEPVEHPYLGKITIGARTIRRWCQRHREKGLKGLVRHKRKDKGALKAIPLDALERAIALRIEDGRRSVPIILELLKVEKDDWLDIKRSTMDTHLRARGSVRSRRGPEGPFISFEAKNPMDLWQGDILHGPLTLFGNKLKRCRIVAWIDDHSRHVCHLQAYPDETFPSVEDALKRAILKYGLPHRLFVDNGKVYSGKALTLACSELGIAKIHSTPRYPVSRGKMERLFRTLRERLLQEVENLDPLPIEKLNSYLIAWADAYHDKEHSRTKETPRKRFAQRPLRPVPSIELLEQAFWQWTTRVVSSHGEIKFEGNIYRVDPSFSGQKVVVRYDPYNLALIHLWRDGRRVTSATTEDLLHRRRPGRSVPKPTRGSQAAERYLEGLVEAHDEKLARECNLTSFPDLSQDDEEEQE
jgi:transposase InsO family protein